MKVRTVKHVIKINSDVEDFFSNYSHSLMYEYIGFIKSLFQCVFCV